jgi:hypothetical protein
VTPGLIDYARIQRHARQPWAVTARLRIPQVIGADESFRDLAIVAAIQKLRVGRKVREEFAGRDLAVVT